MYVCTLACLSYHRIFFRNFWVDFFLQESERKKKWRLFGLSVGSFICWMTWMTTKHWQPPPIAATLLPCHGWLSIFDNCIQCCLVYVCVCVCVSIFCAGYFIECARLNCYSCYPAYIHNHIHIHIHTHRALNLFYIIIIYTAPTSTTIPLWQQYCTCTYDV